MSKRKPEDLIKEKKRGMGISLPGTEILSSKTKIYKKEYVQYLFEYNCFTYISRFGTLKNVQTMVDFCKRYFKHFLRTRNPHNKYRDVCRTPTTTPESVK